MNQAEKEAGAVFGAPAVAKIKAKPEHGHICLINHHKDVITAIDSLFNRLGDIKAAVTYGQDLPPEIRDGVLYMWLGYGEQTINRLGLRENA